MEGVALGWFFIAAADNVLAIIGATNSQTVLKSRLDRVNNYCHVSLSIELVLS